MRLFISINVPEELYKYCKQLQSQFPNIKKTNEFHLTIQFLGDDIKSTEAIIEKLKNIKFSPFEIEMGDVAPFGHPKDPKGVWIECISNPNLEKMASEIRKSMSELGYISDHPFRAHITLGRYKFKPDNPPEKIKGIKNIFSTEHFYLMESILSPTGPIYKKLEEL